MILPFSKLLDLTLFSVAEAKQHKKNKIQTLLSTIMLKNN